MGEITALVALAAHGNRCHVRSIGFENDARKGHRSFEDSRKGAFYTEILVEPFIDTMIVFDNNTLDSWQEDYKEENLDG